MTFDFEMITIGHIDWGNMAGRCVSPDVGCGWNYAEEMSGLSMRQTARGEVRKEKWDQEHRQEKKRQYLPEAGRYRKAAGKKTGNVRRDSRNW